MPSLNIPIIKAVTVTEIGLTTLMRMPPAQVQRGSAYKAFKCCVVDHGRWRGGRPGSSRKDPAGQGDRPIVGDMPKRRAHQADYAHQLAMDAEGKVFVSDLIQRFAIPPVDGRAHDSVDRSGLLKQRL